MSFTPEQFCTTIDGMGTDVTGVLNKFMKKKIQLQRLSQLMYTSGLQLPLPNISSLLPLSMINYSFYNQLRSSCPMLGLPTQTTESLAALQNQVSSAYQQITDGLNGHPFKQLGGMQDQLNELIGLVDGFLATPGFSGNITACLQAACSAGSTLGVYSQDFQAQTLNNFEKMYQQLGPDYGNVLDQTQEAAKKQVDTIQAGITNLING